MPSLSGCDYRLQGKGVVLDIRMDHGGFSGLAYGRKPGYEIGNDGFALSGPHDHRRSEQICFEMGGRCDLQTALALPAGARIDPQPYDPFGKPGAAAARPNLGRPSTVYLAPLRICRRRPVKAPKIRRRRMDFELSHPISNYYDMVLRAFVSICPNRLFLAKELHR